MPDKVARNLGVLQGKSTVRFDYHISIILDGERFAFGVFDSGTRMRLSHIGSGGVDQMLKVLREELLKLNEED